MVTYLDKVLYLYPDIQHVVYWHEKNDMAPFDDPYDRLLWENKDISKPLKSTLDAIPDNVVEGKKEEDIAAAEIASKNVEINDDILLNNLVKILIEKGIILNKNELLAPKAK